jgi:hypothetical protein
MTNYLVPVTVNQLPAISELNGNQGMFILPDGSININRKNGTWMIINKQSDHAGVLKPADVPVIQTGDAKWFWAGAGTYPNAGGHTIDKQGILSYDGVEWKELELDIPAALQFIPSFLSSSFPLTYTALEPIQRVHEGSIWELQVGKTANITDVPNDTSIIWRNIVRGDKVSRIALKSFVEGVETVINNFEVGYYDQNGVFTSNLTTRAYKFTAETEIKISGLLVGSPTAPYVAVLGRKGNVYESILVATGEVVTDLVINVSDFDEVIVNFLIINYPNPSVKSLYDETGLSGDDSVKKFIEGLSYLDKKFKTVLTVENVNFGTADLIKEDDFYISTEGDKISSISALNKSIAVKKGDAINFRGNRLSGHPAYIILNSDGSHMTSDISTDYYAVEIDILKDGIIHFNQSKASAVVDLFLLNRQNVDEHFSVKDYIDLKDGTLKNGAVKILNSSGVYDGYYDIKNAVIGTSHYNNYTGHPDYLVSSLYPVRKGDTLLVTGYFGNNGVGLFGYDGKLLSKLFYSTDIQYTDLGVLIPEDGFIHYSYKKSEPFSLKIYDRNFVESENISTSGVKLVNEKFIRLEKPKFGRIDLRGTLPTDMSSARQSTTLEFDFLINNEKKVTAKVKLSIQGSGSAAYPKKGYTFDIINFQDEKVAVKFGDLVASDSLHLKAYQSDRTHTRDIGMGRIWRDMISKNSYPVSKVNNIPFVLKPTAENAKYIGDAKYHPDGFPTEVYLNGSFLGLYTLRLKKTRENYALNNAVKEHIFLDNGDYEAFFTTGFVSSKWEIKSPKMTGYVDMGPVPDATVLAYINRFFNWTIDFKNNAGTARANAADYIVIKNWIDYKIFCEVFFHHDSIGNNVNALTWNGNQWSLCPYDMDFTIGFWHLPAWEMQITRTGFLTGDIWDSFRSHFSAEIKTRYTELRKSGFLASEFLGNYFDNIAKNIPRSVYEADSKKWSSLFANGEPTLEHIKLFLKNRIEWLDTQWLN